MLSRKNEMVPFEDATGLEFLAQKNECSLFAFASHNQKRPHNLTLVGLLGRCPDCVQQGRPD
jgi:ribosome production factor 2